MPKSASPERAVRPYGVAEQILEKNEENRFLLIQGLKLGVIAGKLPLLISRHMGVADKDVPKNANTPDPNVLLSQITEKGQGNQGKYLAHLESLPFSIDEEKKRALAAKARTFAFENCPERAWSRDPETRAIAADLFEKGLTPTLVAKALSLHIQPSRDDVISPGTVRGWVKERAAETDLAPAIAALRDKLTLTPEQSAYAGLHAEKLRVKVEARKSEQTEWKKNNYARAVVAAILEQGGEGEGAATAAGKLLYDTFGKQKAAKNTSDTPWLSYKSVLTAEISRDSREKIIKRMRDGIYLSDTDKDALLLEAAEIARMYIAIHKAEKTQNLSEAKKSMYARRKDPNAPISEPPLPQEAAQGRMSQIPEDKRTRMRHAAAGFTSEEDKDALAHELLPQFVQSFFLEVARNKPYSHMSNRVDMKTGSTVNPNSLGKETSALQSEDFIGYIQLEINVSPVRQDTDDETEVNRDNARALLNFLRSEEKRLARGLPPNPQFKFSREGRAPHIEKIDVTVFISNKESERRKNSIKFTLNYPREEK